MSLIAIVKRSGARSAYWEEKDINLKVVDQFGVRHSSYGDFNDRE